MYTKKCKDHLGNEYNSKTAMCKHYGVKLTTFNERIRSGYTLEEALTFENNREGKNGSCCKDHLGNEYPSKNAMAIAYGFMSYHQIKDRLYKGWSLEKALTTPTGTTHDNWKVCYDHLGNEYPNKLALCRAYDITFSMYANRLRNGWSLKDALTKPVRTDLKKQTSRIGEKSICSANGMEMEIIDYRSAFDMDIRFEDGVVVEHRSYDNFKRGKIARPYGVDKYEYKGTLIGSRSIAKCGMGMEIIKVHQNHHIDVRFDDGTIVYDKNQSNFVSGTIGHPKIPLIALQKEERGKALIGQKRKNNNGYEMEIVEYRGVTDITVRFSNGDTVISRMNQWNKGTIKEPPTIHIGEQYKANNGQMMTIIKFKSSNNVDVEFEDGTKIYNKSYLNVRTGQIKNPNCPTKPKLNIDYSYRIGERYKVKTGETVEIIEYKKADDVTIKVLETGYIMYGQKYFRIKEGGIDVTDYSKRVGTKQLMNCGLYAECIAYENSSNTGATVEFEDGIIKKCSYGRFLAGEVGYPYLASFGVKKPFMFNSVYIKKLAYKYNSESNYYCVLPDGTQDVLTIAEIRERYGNNENEDKRKVEGE